MLCGASPSERYADAQVVTGLERFECPIDGTTAWRRPTAWHVLRTFGPESGQLWRRLVANPIAGRIANTAASAIRELFDATGAIDGSSIGVPVQVPAVH